MKNTKWDSLRKESLEDLCEKALSRNCPAIKLSESLKPWPHNHPPYFSALSSILISFCLATLSNSPFFTPLGHSPFSTPLHPSYHLTPKLSPKMKSLLSPLQRTLQISLGRILLSVTNQIFQSNRYLSHTMISRHNSRKQEYKDK